MSRLRNRLFRVILTVVGIAVLTLPLSSCGKERYVSQRRVILDTVYFNDYKEYLKSGEYTLWIPKEKGEIETLTLMQGSCGLKDDSGNPKKPVIVRDVTGSERPWALLYTCDPGGGDAVKEQLAELHLRQDTAVKGGAWDHGKFGKGTVSTVE